MSERAGSGDLVSVVIPFLDPDPRFLREAIASVSAQTHPNWELVLVDDGSRSGTIDIVRRLAADVARRMRLITYTRRRTRGISAARNDGIRIARGDFVTFLDADDVYLPDRLARDLATLKAHPEAGFACTKAEYWSSWMKGRGAAADFVPRIGDSGVYAPPLMLGRWLSGEAAVPPICNVTVRRALVGAVGAFDVRFPGLYEDQVFLAKCALASPVAIVDEVTARYRQHPSSMCAGVSAQAAREGRGRFLEWLEGHVAAGPHAGSDVRRVIRRESWKVRHPGLARVQRLAGKALGRRPARVVA